MKIESAAGVLVLFTAYWVLCAFAYISGVFLRYDPTLIGILKFDEIIVSASGRIATVFAILIPLYAVTFFFVSSVVTWINSKTPNTPFPIPKGAVSIFLVSALTISCLAVYFLSAKSKITLPTHLMLPLIGLPIGLIGILGAGYDTVNQTVRGKFASLAIIGLLSSFSSGSEPQWFPEAGEQKCATIYSNGKITSSGPLLYAAQSAVFIRDRTNGSLSYYKVDDVDRLSSAPCKEGQQ